MDRFEPPPPDPDTARRIGRAIAWFLGGMLVLGAVAFGLLFVVCGAVFR